jgi:hypothetical protein
MSRDLDPMAMAEIETEIRRLMSAANDQVRDLAEACRAAGAAEHWFKVSQAKLIFRAPKELKNAEQRVGWAYEQEVVDRTTGEKTLLEDLDFTYRATAAEREAVVERGRMIRTQLEAMRTLAANARPATANSRGVGG